MLRKLHDHQWPSMVFGINEFVGALFVFMVAVLPSGVMYGSDLGAGYTTREERRDAGFAYEFWDERLVLSGLLEIEHIETRTENEGVQAVEDTNVRDISQSIQLDVVFQPADWLELELVYEYEHVEKISTIDEFFFTVSSWGGFSLTGGKFFLPFGEYSSYFVTGPELEFAETRGRGVNVSYEWQLETSAGKVAINVFAYDGTAQQRGSGNERISWGASLEWPVNKYWHISIGYLSDLADSDAGFLQDNENLFDQQVDAAAVFVQWQRVHYVAQFEYVTALEKFTELDQNVAKPRAWNVEVSMPVFEGWQMAFRAQGTRDLDEAPQRGYGIALIGQVPWQVPWEAQALAHRSIYMTFEVLRHEAIVCELCTDRVDWSYGVQLGFAM